MTGEPRDVIKGQRRALPFLVRRCVCSVVTGRKTPQATRADKTRERREMNRGVVLGFVVVLAAPTAAMAQASLERGRYLVDTVMTVDAMIAYLRTVPPKE